LYVPTLTGAEPRLKRRYAQIVMSQLSPLQRTAAGFRALPGIATSFAAAQASWRFYANDAVTLPQLAGPLIERAREGVGDSSDHYALVVFDWCNLHYNNHESKEDRVELSQPKDTGYDVLTGLVISDRDGSPIAPVCLDLRAKDGLHTTRSGDILKPVSALDGLDPLMSEVEGQKLALPALYIIDREADSVAHYRRWSEKNRKFLVRADDARKVLHEGRECTLVNVAKELHRREALQETREVSIRGQTATQFVGEAAVVLHRPAQIQRRRGKKKKRDRRRIKGAALTLRLVACEVRDDQGKLLARWLLLSNAPQEVKASTLALWYYWRWQIESYHKLLKGAGLHVEQWLQRDAGALCKRLLVAAMAAVIVWHLARNPSSEAGEMREVLVRLSGRQMKRGKKLPKFTEPALLAGLGVLLPMLCLLEKYTVEELTELARSVLPYDSLRPVRKNRRGSG
jgi:hypothetical protein